MTPEVFMVDVFGREPFSGNPVAVIDADEALTGDQMQQAARWFNLSETTFLLPPTTPRADYRVRIFSLERELPFAGHPTLGTCRAWLSRQPDPARHPVVVQECAAGLVEIRQGADGTLAFAAPALVRSGAPSAAELDEAVRFLGISPDQVVDAAWVDNGPGWLGIELASATQVLAVDPHRTWPRRVDIGIVGPHPAGSECAYEVRAFFSDQHGGIVEDPVTGSLNAALAQWFVARGAETSGYRVAQGTRLGRTGRVQVTVADGGQVWIGGQALVIGRGNLTAVGH